MLKLSTKRAGDDRFKLFAARASVEVLFSLVPRLLATAVTTS
ncbi:MAG: hypothetical protein SYR96_36960 [Actinomycetota bacterium]|nr:hypothetical protein [Actinomycetota bacterium]